MRWCKISEGVFGGHLTTCIELMLDNYTGKKPPQSERIWGSWRHGYSKWYVNNTSHRPIEYYFITEHRNYSGDTHMTRLTLRARLNCTPLESREAHTVSNYRRWNNITHTGFEHFKLVQTLYNLFKSTMLEPENWKYKNLRILSAVKRSQFEYSASCCVDLLVTHELSSPSSLRGLICVYVIFAQSWEVPHHRGKPRM